MSTSWKLLAEAGVPIDVARSAPAKLPGDTELCAAVESGYEDLVRGSGDVEPLHAWLSAFAHHWPARFQATFGKRGGELLRALELRSNDPNRYIKLRRIAVENLSHAI